MDYSTYKHISITLRQFRIERGLSQQEVAHLLQLKNNTLISRWENGISFPTLINLIKLCGVYKVTLADFFDSLTSDSWSKNI